MVTRDLINKVRGYIATGEKEGAKLVIGGRNFKLHCYENGNFIGGCLFDDVKPEMTIYKEEIFGPRSEEHTSELQSRLHLLCRLLLEKSQRHQLLAFQALILQIAKLQLCALKFP